MVERRKRRTPVPKATAEARCSFCGKPDASIDRMIAGPGVYICNECVGLCNQLLARESVAAFDVLEDKDDEALLASMGETGTSTRRPNVANPLDPCSCAI